MQGESRKRCGPSGERSDAENAEWIRTKEKSSPPDGDNVFLIPNCTSPCLVRQYGDGFRILLDRNGLPKTEIWEATNAQLARVVGIPGMFRLYTGLLATDFLFTLATRLRPYEMHPGSVQELLAASVERLSRVLAERGNIDEVLTEAALDLWAAPRAGNPGSRPVVGVTGDLYTRMNPTGNAGLFERLMQLGCEVWPSPFFATMADLASALDTRSEVLQGRLGSAAIDGLTQALTTDARRKLTRRLPQEVVDLAVEPPADDLIRLAHRYVGPRTNHLIVLTVAKMADFLRRGAAGVINASGINCAVGTASAAAVSAIRADFGNAQSSTSSMGTARARHKGFAWKHSPTRYKSTGGRLPHETRLQKELPRLAQPGRFSKI